MKQQAAANATKKKLPPFRQALLRGLALLTPPLLTVVLFVWAWHTIEDYILTPLEATARMVVSWSIRDIHEGLPAEVPDSAVLVRRQGEVFTLQKLLEGQKRDRDLARQVTLRGGELLSFQQEQIVYVPVRNGKQWIPNWVFETVDDQPVAQPPVTAQEYYDQYVRLRYLRREVVLPVFLCGFVLFLYFTGKFLAAGVGRLLWNAGESLVNRVPIIRNVYSSVKQVSDFVFSEQEVGFNRVVAVEYPRKGIWVLAFATGEGMSEVARVAGEPLCALLVPTSPMPFTGFTVMAKRSEIMELDITLDQAIQFIVSCGVVIPPHQQYARQSVEAAVPESRPPAPRDGQTLSAAIREATASNKET